MEIIKLITISLLLIAVAANSPCNKDNTICKECCLNGKCYTGSICNATSLIINNGISDVIDHLIKIVLWGAAISLSILCCCCFWTVRLIKRFRKG